MVDHIFDHYKGNMSCWQDEFFVGMETSLDDDAPLLLAARLGYLSAFNLKALFPDPRQPFPRHPDLEELFGALGA